MNIRLLTLIVLFLALSSCDNIKDESIESTKIEDQENSKAARAAAAKTQDNWENYYKSLNSDFSMDNFKKKDSYQLVPHSTTTVVPVWDPSFKPVYKNFIKYNADSTKYIDFMSYKLQFDDNNEVILAADQEIVLVDIPHKKTQRILFYGPSYWIEDAYFKNDSTLVLLENSTDQVPAYQEINLNTYQSTYYIYEKELEESSTYLKDKLLSIFDDNL